MMLYLSYTLPAHKSVFRLVRSKGRSPDASASPKNASGPVSTPFYVAPQTPGILRLEVSPVMRQPRLKPSNMQHGRQKWDSNTGEYRHLRKIMMLYETRK